MNGSVDQMPWFGFPHSPWLVMLSVGIAICGGYVGLGLGTWTMHFVGMMAAQLPDGTLYSVLLTLLSFLLCVLVVGVAAFIVSNYRARKFSILAASVIMGAGIVLMHYLGMHAIVGNYMLHHDSRYSVLAAIKTPAGVDIGALSPEEIALSIMAEITAKRRQKIRS